MTIPIISFPPANLYSVPLFLVDGTDKSTEAELSAVPFLAIPFLILASRTSGGVAAEGEEGANVLLTPVSVVGDAVVVEAILVFEPEFEREVVSPESERGNFIRGMKPVLGVVATGVLILLSFVGVVGEMVGLVVVIVVLVSAEGLGSIAVGGGVGEV